MTYSTLQLTEGSLCSKQKHFTDLQMEKCVMLLGTVSLQELQN